MSEWTCEIAREQIPDHVGGRLDAAEADALEAHLDACAECAEELALAHLLLSSRHAVPDGLAERVTAAVRADRRTARRPWWGLTAAAVAALALGIGIASDAPPNPVSEFAYEVGESDLWLGDDGLIAGAPALGDLSEEALTELLTELEVGSAGGAA